MTQQMTYQLTLKKPAAPLWLASGIDPAVIADYVASARTAETMVSETFNPDLAGTNRNYTNRKSFDFDPYGQPNAALIFESMLALAKQHAPALWDNDFSGEWLRIHGQGIKYRAGGGFAPHADSMKKIEVGDAGETRWVQLLPARQLVALLYLDDGYEGGELYFPDIQDADGQPLSIRPRAGDFVLFGGDNRYVHGVREVTSGERHVVTMWYAPLPIEPADTVEGVRLAYAAEVAP